MILNTEFHKFQDSDSFDYDLHYDTKYCTKLIEENNLDITLINARFINPIDLKMLNEILGYNIPVYVIEQVVLDGSLGETIARIMASKQINLPLNLISIPTNSYIPQASLADLLKMFKLDNESLLKELKKYEIR